MTRVRPASPPWPRSVREEIEATDWQRYPVVDVVTFAPATSRGLEGDRQRIEVHRHGEAPPPSIYETGERTFRVERVTRPLFERLEDGKYRRRQSAGTVPPECRR